ncbi:collagen alpha-1(X) chain-like [Anneissia japonica]|uniref:collagen alpha-1(X) chain-like n=1 Tax=Anneissia japonica TaxID=1529436 RepID=UPI0014257E51|nr:collagen alpha-1(X) chain-like [Anneissia japonica]
MDSLLTSFALLIGLISLVTCLPESLSTTTTPEQNVPQTCNMCCHGPPGQPGIPGVPGTPGGYGPAGPSGSKGDRGDFIKGERGDRGEKGEPGVKGLKGDKGSEGSPGKQGPHGQRGPQGPKGNTGSNGEKGEPGLQAPQVRKSAFTAVRTTHVPTSESTILFTSMEINVGEDFDKNTGKFTCRISGFYYFMFSFLSYGGSPVYIKMKLNGRIITSVHRSDPAGNDQLSSGGTVQLNVGDEVWLMNAGGSYKVYGNSEFPLTFTGFMIYDMN